MSERQVAFNRTIVELKQSLRPSIPESGTFNRTIVELNQIFAKISVDSWMASVKLKQSRHKARTMPIWNIEDLQQGEEDKMGEQEQYRIVEVDSPLYGSYYVVQYAHRTLFLNRLVWKDLFDSRDSRAGDGMFFSFIAAKGALERHLDEKSYESRGEGDSNPNVTPEHEDFSDGGDIDF